jgi:DNA-binding NarL/FixJ family response regulator
MEVLFTDRENEILNLLAHDRTVKQAASQLCVCPKTVFYHLNQAKERLGVHNLPALIGLAVASGSVVLSVPEEYKT